MTPYRVYSNFLIALSVVCLLGCTTPKKVTLGHIQKVQTSEHTGEWLAELSSDAMGGRKPGTQEMEKATRWIEKKLEGFDLKPFFFSSFRDTVAIGSRTSFNLVGLIPAKENSDSAEYILIGAHFDHVGKDRSGQDSVFNGANDNASGVVAVLQVAEFLAKYRFDKNVIIALFTEEESGLNGSAHLAERMKAQGVNLKYVINFEMIGKQMTDAPAQVYITGYEKSDFAEVFNRMVSQAFVKNLPEEKEYGLFMRSDNYPFYEAFRIPSHTISSFDFKNYNYYHHVKDEHTELDVENMNKIINISTLGIVKLLTESAEITMR